MDRRGVLSMMCSLSAVSTAGCLFSTQSSQEPELAVIELENHRPDRSYEFTLQITNGEEQVFRDTYRLDQVGSGSSSVTIEDPVNPGEYTIHVKVEDFTETVKTQELVSKNQQCIRLRFYIDSDMLHTEYQLDNKCS